MSYSENRYLLILTENYAALPIMQQHLLRTADDAIVIFGSSFPNDQEYTQVKSMGGETLCEQSCINYSLSWLWSVLMTYHQMFLEIVGEVNDDD